MATQRDRTIALLSERGLMRRADLTAAGIHAPTLSRLVAGGMVVRAGRGVYELAGADVSLSHSLAEVAVRVPKGVICLISALHHHGITLQNPGSIWVAIGQKDRRPCIAHLSVRFVHFGASALAVGVEAATIDGVSVLITSPARTIVDCFRFRRVVGLDVALEALRLGVRSGKARPADIARFAKTLRIWSVLRPYLESIAADDT